MWRHRISLSWSEAEWRRRPRLPRRDSSRRFDLTFRRPTTGSLFRAPHQARLHWIALNVVDNAVPFVFVSHPMIVGLRLPEGFPRAPQEAIRQPPCRTLQGL